MNRTCFTKILNLNEINIMRVSSNLKKINHFRMKSIMLVLLFVFISTVITFSQTMTAKDSLKAKKNAPFILFENTTHDFGTIPYKGDGSFDFKFKNTGKTPLIISNCQSSCGCTVPNWPKDPINKNGNGIIKVKYRTTRVGPFQKTVTIVSNSSNSPVVITIKGTVEKAPEEKTVPTKEETVPSINKVNK